MTVTSEMVPALYFKYGEPVDVFELIRALMTYAKGGHSKVYLCHRVLGEPFGREKVTVVRTVEPITNAAADGSPD
jgi:hypothetical protein